jgi:hypothetical protein
MPGSSGSGIESVHPAYAEKSASWAKMNHTAAGADAVKDAQFTYLPATGGQLVDGAAKRTGIGWDQYVIYRDRAEFLDLVQESIQTLVGVMHQEPPVISLPPEMEPLRTDASRRGETLEMLLRRINEGQLKYGRVGLLADFPTDGTADLPHIVYYEAQHIVNWDDERFSEMDKDMLSLVVLNETAVVRGKSSDRFSWETERRFRALLLQVDPATEEVTYTTWVEVDGVQSEVVAPNFRGTVLGEIPFTFIGANDLSPMPDDIPLEPVANGTISLYQQSADYRATLHMQGQDTLVIEGPEVNSDGTEKDETNETRVGAGAIIRTDSDGKAYYIGISGESLQEQRLAYNNLLDQVREKGARLLEGRKGQAESGDALKTRVAASTASLKTVALTGAAGMESELKAIARWIGADEDLVSVTPNLDFSQAQPEPRLLVDYAKAINEDEAPLSRHSLHAWAQRQNFTKLGFDEEQILVEAEREVRRQQAADAAALIAPIIPADDEPGDDEDDDDDA